MLRLSVLVFFLVVTVIYVMTGAGAGIAGEKEEELQSLLGRYARCFPEYQQGLRYDLYYALETVTLNEPEELPVLVEVTGTFASKTGKAHYYFHLERVVNRLAAQVSYESGLRTPRDVRFGISVDRPLTGVWVVPEEQARVRPFVGGVYDHDPWFAPVQQLLDLVTHDPFDGDNLLPLKIIEDGIDERGRRWFAYAPVRLPGAVYVIVFDKTQKWLPVSYRQHYHPSLVDGKLNELMKDISQLDETKYKEWKIEASVSTEWQGVNGVYLPQTIRSVQKTRTVEMQVVFQYRNWQVGDKAVADLFDVEKFEKQQFPREDYFIKIREALEKKEEEGK